MKDERIKTVQKWTKGEKPRTDNKKKAVPWLRRLVAGPLTAEAQVRYRVSQCGVCGVQSDTWTRFTPPPPIGCLSHSR
jgi:hypothetical protein